jgi:hypothetical protein
MLTPHNTIKDTHVKMLVSALECHVLGGHTGKEVVHH